MSHVKPVNLKHRFMAYHGEFNCFDVRNAQLLVRGFDVLNIIAPRHVKTTIPWAVRLSWLENDHIHAHFFRRAIFTRKVGQTDLVLGVQSRIINRSVRARLYVSVCSG